MIAPKRILTALALVAAIASTANAANSAADESIPGTDIHRPPTDALCDKSFDAGDWAKAARNCREAVGGYRVIVDQARGESENAADSTTAAHMAYIAQALKYDLAYTLFECAFADEKLIGPDKTNEAPGGHAHAEEAYALYRDVHDGYWRKINAVLGRDADNHSKIDPKQYSAQLQQALDGALTEDERELAASFVALMMRVHALYPDIFATEAKAASEESDT